MKKAAIVIGTQNSGKSTTIRKFMEMVKVENAHEFNLDGKWGYLLLTSFEEADRDVTATVKRRSGYDFLVFACQGPKLKQILQALKKASFTVTEVRTVLGEPAKNAKKQAMVIFKFFKSK